MFDRLLQHSFDTKRLTAIEGTNKKEYTANLTMQRGFIQPFGDEENLENQRMVQMFKLFCNRIDLKLADKIVWGSDEYVVRSLKDFNYGTAPHLEAILVKE
jgi:hypothetical protein